MELEILFEDEYCICVNKPNDMLVHHAKLSRSIKQELSLLQLIFEKTSLKVYPVHRLDRRTSGVVLLAKNTVFVSKFQALFTENSIQKTYFGVVRGFAPAEKTIDSPVKGRDATVYKEALTEMKTLTTITLNIPVKPYETSRYSLVELHPKTGRMHQLRVHMTKISHPLIGDGKYGDKNHDDMFLENFGYSYLFLHAGKLEFIHPFSHQKLELKATFPENWINLFERFSWKNPLS
jgi:tRNA pseudouridine65 synthase